MKYPECRCGGRAKYVDNGPFLDQFKCNKCGYQTQCYYDGAEYAQSEWNKEMNPPKLDDYEQRTLKRLLDKESKWKKYSDRN